MYMIGPTTTKASMERVYEVVKHITIPPKSMIVLYKSEERLESIGAIMVEASFVSREVRWPEVVPS